MPRRPTAVLLVAALVSGACAARSAPPSRPDARERLRRDLQAIFADTAVEHVQWGVKIVSLRDEATLYSLNASRFMVPASNQKLLTAAAAAERLGWEHRFTTRVLATGPLEADGTLKGDLVIVGDGDPTINPRHQARWGVFDQWAARLRARGLTTVAGDLVGDDNAFAEPGWGTGWAWDNLQYGYGAPVGALQYHENQIDVLVSPGAAVGAPAAVTFTPPAGGMQIANHVVTTTAGGRTEVDIARVPGRPILDVRGRIPAGAREVTITAAVDNPTAFYVEAFRAALARHGITVSGRAVDVDELAAPPSFEQAIELVVDRSPPLDEIIDVAMKWSRNGYAETLLLALARERPATPTAGLAALTETLAAWKIPAEAYLPRDGSGLSRYDYVSADALAALLQALAADAAHAAPFRATLPVAGVSGTLADRLKGTPAEGRVVAKTGTLSNVRALSGYLTTLRGEPLAFSILANNFRLPSADIDALVDRALLRLVDFRRQGR